MGLFMVPEEVELPSVLAKLGENLESHEGRKENTGPASTWVSQAIVDPLVNALHVALRVSLKPEGEEGIGVEELLGRVLKNGLDSLSRQEQRMLLLDRHAALCLHILARSLAPGSSPPDGR
jgi:membrane glycosyltransferase